MLFKWLLTNKKERCFVRFHPLPFLILLTHIIVTNMSNSLPAIELSIYQQLHGTAVASASVEALSYALSSILFSKSEKTVERATESSFHAIVGIVRVR